MYLNVAYRTQSNHRVDLITPDLNNLHSIVRLLSESKDVISFKIWGEDGSMTKTVAAAYGIDDTKLVQKLFKK